MKKWLLCSLPLLMLTALEAKMVRIDKAPSSSHATRLISSDKSFEESGYYSEMMDATFSEEANPIILSATSNKAKPGSSSSSLALTQDPQNEKAAKPLKKNPKPKNDSSQTLDKELQQQKEKGASVRENDKFYPLSTSRTYPASNASHHSTSSYEHTFIKTLSILLVLIILIFATIWMFRRFSFGGVGSSKAPHGKGIRVIERRALSPKSMLYMVEVKGQQILIAESQLEVRSLMPIEEKEDLDADL